jgi:hypothetical protein
MIEEKLLRLERMSHAEKIGHWIDERPWDINGVTLRLPFKSQPFGPGLVHMDDDGNIIKSPMVVNRPCFGQPTALLRHGGNQHTLTKTGGRHPNRCARCEVKEACEFVCEKRLTCTEELRSLYEEWKHRGGRTSSWPKKGPAGSAKATLRHLLAALKSQVFASDNDERVQKYYEAQIEQHRLRERERKRRERVKSALQSAREGQLSPEIMQVLKEQCHWRSKRYEDTWHLPSAPLSLRKVKDRASRVFDALVWLACKRIEFRGRRVNPSSVAREIQELGLETDRNHNALRDKVRRSMDRIAVLESMPMPDDPDGSPVWPPFNSKHLRKAVHAHTLQQHASKSDDEPTADPLQD